jgi:hypothetical protein
MKNQGMFIMVDIRNIVYSQRITKIIEMKKVYILVLLLVAKFGFSQTIETVHPTLSFSGPDNASHSIDVEIKNTGTIPLKILCQRVNENLAPTHESYFCWAECYVPAVSLSPVTITLQPDESTINFHGYVTPFNHGGADVITYQFYDSLGMSDTLTLVLDYNFIHDGINELNAAKNILNISVNEDKTATINYVCGSFSNSKIQISNILGKVIREIDLNDRSATLKVPMSEITQGVYFCNIITDGKFTTSKKFIIQE